MQALLAGLRVVEGSAFVAAPSCGMTLAQMGADVIRFDQIGGGIDYRRWPVTADNNSIYWADLNKGKRSFAVDLRHPQGRELVRRLITAPGDDRGIMLTNLPARGWLAYEELQKDRADLIQVAISGNRHGGTALDYTVNAVVGFPYLTGHEDDKRPVNHVLPAWDLMTGNLAALSILAAERHRRNTGEGQQITLALADVAYATLGNLGYIGDRAINGTERERGGNYLYGALGRDFLTADGERVMVIALSAKQWQSLLDASGLTASMEALAARLNANFDHESDRYHHRREISRVLEHWIGQQKFTLIAEKFDAHRVCWGRYQTLHQALDDDRELSAQNPLFSPVEQPHIGTYLVPGVPMNFSAVDRHPARRAPMLGEHTDDILAETLGLSAAEIGKLHDQGIVAAATA